jgi:hypothetical protein
MATRVAGKEEGKVGKGDGDGNKETMARRQRDDDKTTTKRRRDDDETTTRRRRDDDEMTTRRR